MDIRIFQTKGLSGTITSSPSKSYSHRAFFLSLLANCNTQLSNPLVEGDAEKTIQVCRLLGAKIGQKSEMVYQIDPPDELNAPQKTLECGNSGTTIRILSALSLLITGPIKIEGIFFQKDRPLDPLLHSLKSLGSEFQEIRDSSGKRIGIQLENKKITSNMVEIPGNISSQFITGLIIAAVGLNLRPEIAKKKQFTSAEFVIRTTTPVKSYPYLLITKNICQSFGMHMLFNKFSDNSLEIKIPISEKLLRKKGDKVFFYNIHGDFSSAAFLLSAAAIFGIDKGVTINQLNIESPQGDKQILNILGEMGAKVKINRKADSITIVGRKNIFSNNLDTYIPYLNNFDVNCKDIPDLFPILCVLASYSQGLMKLKDIQHIKLKETDRVSVMVRELGKFGVKIQENEDMVIIQGYDSRTPLHSRMNSPTDSPIDSTISKQRSIIHDHDHRIIMALIVFLLGMTQNDQNDSEQSILVQNVEYIKDSYPLFLEHLRKIGARIEEM
ncbi:MAG: hypothetical protein GF364_10310 [Candidatus Lokiarchaeota archaeon]|nr:hypothetical protein [Candidatus Lokiarchaeota archaeon]